MTTSGENQGDNGRNRDREVAYILGIFFLVLAVPVAVGTFAATLPIDRLLSASASGILFAVGGLFLWLGRRWSAQSRQ